MPSNQPPEGWRWSELTDLARLESGHTPSRRHPEWWGGSIPWITLTDARANHGKTIRETLESTNELGIANSSARLLPAGTVCLSRTASVGYVVVMGRPMATSQDFVDWVCSERLDPRFLKYLLLSEGKDGLRRFSSGAVHQTVYFPEVKAFCICHPSVPEQKRIVAILDEALKDIATARANAEKNLGNARAIFESHRDGVFTRRGDGWSEKPLGELCDFKRGLTYAKSDEVEVSQTVVLRATNVNLATHSLDLGELRYIRDGFAVPSDKRVRSGSLLICTASGSKSHLGKVAFIDKDYGYAFGGFMGMLTPRGEVLPRYLLHLMTSGVYRDFIGALSDGVNINNLKFSDLGQLPVPLPNTIEQQRLIGTFDALEHESSNLAQVYQRKLATLDSLKQSLLHHAFSGQL